MLVPWPEGAYHALGRFMAVNTICCGSVYPARRLPAGSGVGY